MDREINFKIVALDLSDDTQVNSGGGTHVTYIKPDVGYIYEVINIEYRAVDPDGGGASTSGTHQVEFQVPDQLFWLIKVVADFGNNTSIFGSGFNGNNSETPAAVADQYEAMHKWLSASNSCPITVTYTNNTDKHQTGTRDFHVLVKKRREAI